VKIEYDGRVWDFSLEDMSVAECEAVERYVGKGLGEWANQMSAGAVRAIIALWWVMRNQAGDNPGPPGQPGDGFRPVKLLAAFHAAERAEPEPEPEPDPTSLPAPSSPGSGGTTTTTDAAGSGLSLPG